ncbi:hypothetical protein J6590_098362 [Homalodisca vitripennis]|nr:hypothetical protein J6590_098362 [Homalodisca vitripennis]
MVVTCDPGHQRNNQNSQSITSCTNGQWFPDIPHCASGVVGGGCRDVTGLIRPDTATAPAPRCNLQGLAVLALNMSFTRCSTCRRYIRLPRNGSPQTEAKSRHEGQSHALPPLRRANEVQTVTSAFRNKYSTLP